MVNKTLPNLRITGVHPQTQEDLINIAKNKGITRTDFFRKEIIKIMEQYPEPTPPPINNQQSTINNPKEIAVFGLPPNVKNKLEKVAKSMNMQPSEFLKPHLHDLAASFPEHMKKPPLDY